MHPWDQFTGVNAGYVYELYERFQRDPGSVDEATRSLFARWSPLDADERSTPVTAGPRPPRDDIRAEDTAAAIATFRLAESIRRFGHLAARLDPLGVNDPIGDPSLQADTHGLNDAILARLPASIVGGAAAEDARHALQAIETLRSTYCATTGHDYNHVFVPEERAWLRQAVETGQFRPPRDPINAGELLDRITQVEVFERFLHRTFPGKTRFSIEGLDMMIPILDEIIHDAAASGVQHVMIAMAHRGGLNVLAHILQKP
jgi:2-oxoglutarate dehydrogenase E1 component